ncbi:MAG TPA: chemotaxis protein CheB, partial [Hyphomicrobiaceae bacterium]|nr:chemotaxis protein CheB [Hyphomicrobiaceae bacterium]
MVGIGASAGGLEAFQAFLSTAPPDGGLAYVLVQHLDPNHESMLAELLGRHTELPVRQIVDGTAIEPDNVYLIPPNASLSIADGRLLLAQFSEPRGFRRPIDVFFRSLAADQGSNAACIVLSGTGADGADGLRAMKEAGGLTIVQEPRTAKYDGMPRSAVATGLVDKVLEVREMPAALRDYFVRASPGSMETADLEDFLSEVCAELRHRVGHDFSQYKRSTMSRRIKRRMQVVGAETGSAYLTRLREDTREPELLLRDLLINVTCFFREAEAFDLLRREVIPNIVRDKTMADTVRVWTPGCSSGEEAYSIAILFAEELSRSKSRPAVQIIATDIDEPMLQKARLAAYPHSAVRDVPIALLDRYFFAREDDYVLVPAVRDMVRISNHNLIKDPPFSRLDMIVCRNLLIYLNADLQQRLIPLFHYALRDDGWLFLGSAENIAARSDLFQTVEATAKIYRRVGARSRAISMPMFVQTLASIAPERKRTETLPDPRRVEKNADLAARRVMESYAPPHVVVNEANEVVWSSNRTGKYLELAEGIVTARVTDLVKRGLRSAVRSALDTVRSHRRRIIRRDLRVATEDDGVLYVDLIADPLTDHTTLLVFRDAPAQRTDIGEDNAETLEDQSEDRLRQVEDELHETTIKLRVTVEELETSNEELKSSNEEMMSMNEELQSTNEELATVNEELKNKVDQLATANSDLQNFIESTQVPTIFLDKTMRVRNFTPASQKLFRFQEQDKGRLFSDVASRMDAAHLESLARTVLSNGVPTEEELSIDNGAESYVLRVLPYRDQHEAVVGVILVFTDVTKIRLTQEALARNEGIARQRSEEIEKLYKTAPVGMALVDRNRRFLKINQQFATLGGRPIDDLLGRSLAEALPALSEKMDRAITEVFQLARDVTNLEISVRLHGAAIQDFLIDLYPYEEDGRVIAVGVILKEVTELRRLEKELRLMMYELQHRVKNTLATVTSIVNQTAVSKADRKE